MSNKSMKKKKRGLSPRKKQFCRHYVATGDAQRSVVLAGYQRERAGITAQRLLSDPGVLEECARIRREEMPDRVKEGLERIAFGSINDVVRLMLDGELDEEALMELDLFAISAISRSKGGTLEIRFYDRMQAMRILGEMAGGTPEDGAVGALQQAIREGAAALRAADPVAD